MKLVLVSVLVLVQVLVLVSAQDKDQECEAHKKTIPPNQLRKVEGDWVLVWAAVDGKAAEVLPNVTSSHLELRLTQHNLHYNERNSYLGPKCSNYILNVTEGEDNSLVSRGGMVETDGKIQWFEDNATIDFYHSDCPHCLKMSYQSLEWGRYLLMYRREGHHRDVENMKKDHEQFQKQAKCLGLPLESLFVYDGKADFCHKKSDVCEGHNTPLQTDQLHKVEGDWVLVWYNYDGPKHVDDPMPEFASSHVEIRLRPDNNSLSYHERNVYQGGKCAAYVMNFTIPEDRDEKQHHLEYTGGTLHKDGVLSSYNDTATAYFYETADHRMKFVYNSKTWRRWLFIYRREGHHTDQEQLKGDHGHHQKTAECLGFTLNQNTTWHYDGKTDFCHKKSAPEKTES